MHLSFDISDLATGRADGTTRYTHELAKRLPNLSGNHAWTYFSSAPVAENYNLQPTNFKLAVSRWPKYWTQMRLPWDLYKFRPDVLFMPIQQIPYLRPKKMKTVAVVHDLAVHKYPEQFTYKDWVLLHVFSAYVAREADEIIAVSKATADDIAKYYGRTEKVTVIHHGVDHDRFRPPTDDIELQQAWSKIIAKYPRIKKPYLLYVGQIQPRKNLVSLIEAFGRLAADDKDLQLVIAGGHGWLQQEIVAKAKASKNSERIQMVGAVPDDLLTGLYWHAELFVLPSLYEGFGMPILEAMACGCPVVTSNTSSMPEVAGKAAALINPNSIEDMVLKIIEARQEKEVMQKAGIVQASKFDWHTTARKTMAVIERTRSLV